MNNIDTDNAQSPADTHKDSGYNALEKQDAAAVTPEYPTGFNIAIIILGLCFAIFCVAIDGTIIATAIPRITDQFHSLQDIGWYASAYLLLLAAFQLFYGKLYVRFSSKVVFLVALFIFEVGSLICATAPNSIAFILGRAIAGLGAAGLFSGCFVIVAQSSPIDKRPAYSSALGATYGVGSVVGPLIGGAFTSRVTWRWCFYINLPIGGVSALVIVLFLHLKYQIAAGQKKNGIVATLGQLDPLGTFLFVPGIICLLLALQWGGTTYAWNSGRVIALLVLFGVLMIAFVAVQFWLKEAGTIPPRIMTQRTVVFASLFSFLLGGSYFILIYFLPVWFQAIKSVSALHSGVDTIPFVLSMAVGTIFSGALTTKLGHYMPYVYGSVVFISIATGLITTFQPGTSHGKWIGYQILYGFGAGLAFQLPQIAVQAVLPLADVSVGVAITFFTQILAGALFVSICNNIFDNKLVKYVGALNIPSVDAKDLVKLGATEIRSYIPPQYLTEVLEAYNHALVKIFQVALVVACLSALAAAGMEWKSVKPAAVVEDTQDKQPINNQDTVGSPSSI
ncbi:MAG: hypothetical protein MMC33_003399 [Icmadophila ericetorum]|nr:hypothetical protein [Icmadophila ericetorum]